MPPNPIARLRAHRVRRLAALLSGLMVLAATPAAAQAPYEDRTKPEGWAWALIRQGEDVDFDDREGCAPAPKPAFWRDDRGLDLACRTLPGSFLTNILTQPLLRSQIPSRGVTVIGALIAGPVDLRNAQLSRALSIRDSRLAGDLILDSARTDSEISIANSHLEGSVDAQRMRSEMSFTLSGSTVEKAVSLRGARMEGAVELSRSALKGALDASSAQVRSLTLSDGTFQDVTLIVASIAQTLDAVNTTVKGTFSADSLKAGRVLMVSRNGQASFQAVRFASAKIDGQLSLRGATFGGSLNLNSLSAKHVFMGSSSTYPATFKDVNLVAARIDGNVEMDGSTFDGLVDAHGMSVGGTFFMGLTDADKAKYELPGKASFKRVDIHLVKVGGHLYMEDARFEGELLATSVDVGGDLVMCAIASTERISLAFSRVGGSLDARGATLASLDLEGAAIGADLKLGKHEKGRTMGWGDLNLKNARVTNLVDVADAWPPPGHLHIEGFAFSRLGEHRDPKWWDEKWIRHDPRYTPGPYEQLAAAFAAAGNRGAADEMRFRGRARQREAESNPVGWVVAIFLEFVAGFGIGDYTFRVLFWVVGISLLGAAYLWVGVEEARRHGRLWCFGASLSRLLPVIEINKEFTDFFDDPERKRLTARQSMVFSGICLVGWLLGAILVAAIAGLTQEG